MNKSPFDIESQQQSLTSKVVVGLERISEVFKKLLWDQSKSTGLSPIQIQILVFVAYHKSDLCKVSYLAQEFNVTKPTISDAVRVLLLKGLTEKLDSGGDSRSYVIGLTTEGRNLLQGIEQFASPVGKELEKLPKAQLANIYQSLTTLINQLNQSGILSVQRICFSCRYYEKRTDDSFCHLLNQPLAANEIRIDCPEYQIKVE